MVPWITIIGAVAQAVFPRHRTLILSASAISSLLLHGRRKGKGRAGIRSNRKSFSGGVKLEWRNLTCKLAGKKGSPDRLLLDHLNGSASPGRLLAIIGPSGSGKTTLLNSLAGQLPAARRINLRGSILANGVPVQQSTHRQVYVRQEDIFFSQLTVRETLMTAARLQLPKERTEEEKQERVDALLRLMGLSNVHDTIVGDNRARGISGGEKKRLSIACELLANPAVVFADEPTTGLDAFQAERVMMTLKELATQGRTVVCSIHQPRGSVYDLFDDVTVLAQGQLVYSGPAGHAPLNYFAKLGHECGNHVNPAEFLSDLIGVDESSPETREASGNRIASFIKAYASQAATSAQDTVTASSLDLAGGEIIAEDGTDTEKGFWEQFGILFQRAWKQTTRDKATNFVRTMMNVTSAMIFGSIFWRMGLTQTSIQDRMGLLQVVAINTAMSSLIKTTSVFPRERQIVDRERASHAYDVAPYFLSKLVAELPVTAFFPAVFGVLVYPMTGLHKSLSRFARFLTVLTVESFTASAMGLTAGAIAPTTEAASALGPSVMTVFIVFGGYYVNADNTPAIFRWIPNLSLIRWAFQGLCINEFDGLKFEVARPTDLPSGQQVLERLSFDQSTVSGSIAKETQILILWYWAASALLRAKEPVFERVQEEEEEEEKKGKESEELTVVVTEEAVVV